MRARVDHGGRRLIMVVCLAAATVGCVTTTRPLVRTAAEIQAAHGVTLRVPDGWTLSEPAIHFMDVGVLELRSTDGMTLVVELTPRPVDDLEKRVEVVRAAYGKRFPTGRFHTVGGTVGPWPATGFDGTVLGVDGDLGRRVMLFRCFNAAGRHVSIQAEAAAAVWAVRRADVDALLAGLQVRPEPAP